MGAPPFALISTSAVSCPVLKYNGVLFIGEDIVSVGGQLFEIVAAKRQIGFADGVPVFVHRDNLQQAVGGNDAAVSCGQLLGGKQSKGHGGKLAVHADAEALVLLQYLIRETAAFCRSLQKPAAVSVISTSCPA